MADELPDISGLKLVRGDIPPRKPGHYLCYPTFWSPVVLYWNEKSTDWRRGDARMTIVAYAGPIPDRVSSPLR